MRPRASIRPYFKRRLSPRRAALESALVPADWSRVDQGRSKNPFNELFASSEKSSEPQILSLGRLQKLANRLMESVKSNTPFFHNGECAKSKTGA
jgi:hypothetical protein